MIALVLVMMRVRAAHAATVLVLAALAIGASVAAPLYIRTAQRSVTRVDLSAAAPGQLTVLSSDDLVTRPDPGNQRAVARASAERAKAFDQKANEALTIPGFARVFAVGMDITMSGRPMAPVKDPQLENAGPEHWLEYREGVCGHLSLTAGRCPGADGEVVVGPASAQAFQLHPGSLLYVRNMVYVPPPRDDPGAGYWEPSGEQTALSVVGVYGGVRTGDVFFTGGAGAARGGDEPVYTTRHSIAAIDHQAETQRVLAYPAGALDPDRFAQVEPDVRKALNSITGINGSPQSNIAPFLLKVSADRAQVAVLPGVLQLPLIVLCCFVVFLAAANTAQSRRIELGMLKLRGSTLVDRVWLASAEIVLPLLAGGVVGYLLGQAAVWLLARATLSVPTTFTLTTEFLPQAGLALLAVVVAGLVGLRRDLATPVAELLRRVPSRGGRWGSVVLRTVVIALAIAALVQVRTGGAELTGLARLAPAAVILALALVFALAFDPLVGRWGRRAVRRGRVGPALAMLHLARRRSGSRVVALLAVAVGLVGYVGIAYGTGTAARHNEVVASLGTQRVVSVPEMTMRALLTDVRAADPDGTFAMAAMPVGATSTPIWAVDTPRLGAIGPWPDQGGRGLDVAGAQRVLRPALGPSVVVRGTGLRLTAPMAPASAKSYTHLAAVLAPLDGSVAEYVRLVPTGPNADTYQAAVKCPAGCRISALVIADYNQAGPFVDVNAQNHPVTVTFAQLAQTGPDAPLAGPAEFGHWVDRQAAELTLAPGPAGFAVTVGAGSTQQVVPGWIGPPDQPQFVPMLTPTSLAQPPRTVILPNPVVVSTANIGVTATAPMQAGGSTTVLPRVGSSGVLVDMETLARVGEPGPSRVGGEVWLGPSAPADALDRLKKAGLTVLSVRDFDTVYTQAAGGPNAVGLQFLLVVGVLCLALGGGGLAVAATVEMRARADELRALRRQGASRWVIGRAGRQSYLVMVVAGTLAGAVAAVAAWLLTRDRLPVVDELVTGVPVPAWPGLTPVLAWLGATAILLLVAMMLSVTLTRTIRNGGARVGRPAPVVPPGPRHGRRDDDRDDDVALATSGEGRGR